MAVNEPAAVAVAMEFPPAPAMAKLTPVPETLVPFADRVCVPAAPAEGDGAITVIAPADDESVMFDPATS